MTTLRQPTLFEAQTVGAPHNGTLTSFRAAQSIAPHVGPMQQRILDYIRENGPSTEEEISLGAGMRLSSVCGRVNELVHQKGLLADTGEVRRTSSGRFAVVWGISPSSVTNRSGESAGEGRGRIE